jgi:hypothetical protein
VRQSRPLVSLVTVQILHLPVDAAKQASMMIPPSCMLWPMLYVRSVDAGLMAPTLNAVTSEPPTSSGRDSPQQTDPCDHLKAFRS